MKKENSQFSGYMLIAVFVIPLLIAIAMYSLRDHLPSMSSVSHGALIHPAEPIKALTIVTKQNKTMSLEEIKGKWTYIVYAPNGCDLECEASLFKLRQTKTATGRETNRIQSVLLLQNGVLNSAVALRNPKTIVGRLKKLEVEAQPGVNKALIPGSIYLLDPHANMMMQYDGHATSKGMLKDIKKLLKISNIG